MVPLDGANAALVTETTLKNLPGGEYDVTVVLVDANGRRTPTDGGDGHVNVGVTEPRAQSLKPRPCVPLSRSRGEHCVNRAA